MELPEKAVGTVSENDFDIGVAGRCEKDSFESDGWMRYVRGINISTIITLRHID